MSNALKSTTENEKLSPFLSERLGNSVLILQLGAAGWENSVKPFVDRYAIYFDCAASIRAAVEQAPRQSRSQGIQLNETYSLALAAEPARHCLIMTIQAGSSALCCTALDCALESWRLCGQIQHDQLALQASALQIAQSYEEQNWLRSFARSVGSINRANSANSIAQGIFEPLRHLLHAEDLYLLVDSDETERSGLQSCQYGSSGINCQQVRDEVARLQTIAGSLIIKKNVSFPGERIRSMVAVGIRLDNELLGHLVAINRQPSKRDVAGLVASDEFIRGEISLMEEAAMLLSSQAQNIHLVLESHQLVLGTLHAMSSSIDARDPYTQGHSERVGRLAFELAKILGVSETACQEIYLAGLLHDLGKIGIPDHILHKEGPLSDEEFATIKQHPEIGYRIIERLGKLHFALPGVLYHHERWDGKGYPHGLKGESIPLMARILAVADSFDAMTSSRPYRDAMQIEKAVSIITNGAGQQWDTAVVDCFKIWLSKTLPSHPSAFALEAEDLIAHGAPFESISQAVIALNL